jgi:predicted P-loop ATPase
LIARPAYGWHRVDRPRRCIFIATTNAKSYLKSQTGNRRFWPVKVGRIDLDKLRADRDQLWAEAVAIEATGCSLVLPEQLWAEAAIEQERRLDVDPWVDILANVVGTRCLGDEGQDEERVATTESATHVNKNPCLTIDPEEVTAR